MARPKLRTRALRDRVLHVAVATLAGDGVAGFTTRKVAEGAETSVPAVYELFGDKAGLVRQVFFFGFRKLRRSFDQIADSGDPRADQVRQFEVFRSFALENRALTELMFSRPFADFDPGADELRAGSAVRELVVGRVRGCTAARVLEGDETDIAHVLLALAQGLALQETAGWLGRSKTSRDRRWALAFRAAIDGLARRRGCSS